MIEITAGGNLAAESAAALAVPVGAERSWGPGADWVVAELGEWLTDYLDDVDFTGKPGTAALVPTGDRIAYRHVILVGVGADPTTEDLRQAAGTVARKSSRMAEVATTLHSLDTEGAARAVAEGFLLGQYRFNKLKSDPKPPATVELRFVGDGAAAAAADAEAVRPVTEAVSMARDLVNEPAAGKSPEDIVAIATEMAADAGLEITVYDETQFDEECFGGLRGVAAGAHNPARMLVLRHDPPGATASLALVGKGIVFDSGGLSLKPANMMEDMKTDMSGAAAVIAALGAIARMGVAVRVVAATPLTENMPGGGAVRPGDVLRARNGKTMEVLNTDAEGRLVLADGLSLVAEEEPDLIVDVATLTGACKIALGDKIAGLFGNDDNAIAMVEDAAAAAGERVWPLPLPDDYRRSIDSEMADMKNTGSSRYGGAIFAALFLREFVGETPWAHLDIAGPARWPDSEHYQSKGGSGFGVRTLVELARRMAE